MPLMNSSKQETNVQRAKAIVQARKLGYEAAHILMVRALELDGVTPTHLHPEVRPLAELPQDDRNSATAALAELEAAAS